MTYMNLYIQEPMFQSFMQGGFECATQRRCGDKKRLDLLSSTQHDIYAFKDYTNFSQHNILTVRDGIRWNLIEATPGYYNWSSFIPMLRAAQASKTQVIWDLCHYGWPDFLSIWEPKFIHHFANFAAAVAQLIKDETDEIPFYSPINEISFWAWAGGDVGYFNPHACNRGLELKTQLVRASIAAIHAIRDIEPYARFIQAEPLINVVSEDACHQQNAYVQNEAQYQAFDMLTGRSHPELGGNKDLLDIIGANYYPHNQWIVDGTRINHNHPRYQPLCCMLKKLYSRYNRPLFIAETSSEGDSRPEWLQYVCDEVYQALNSGIPVHGICWYPILDYPGWDDDRYCPTGLFATAAQNGYRPVFEPLAQELELQSSRFTLQDRREKVFKLA